MYNIIMLCTRVKTHNFTDISAKQFFFYLKTVLRAAGVDPVVKNTYLAAIGEEKNDNIYDAFLCTENYDVTAAASNGFFILSINYISVDLSASGLPIPRRPYNIIINVLQCLECSHQGRGRGGTINLMYGL